MANQELPLEQWLRPLTVPTEKLPSLACMLCDTYGHLALHSSEQFLPTPVTNLPPRRDEGEYLAIDFGGTNLRIAFITLLGTEHDKRSPQIEKSNNGFVTNDGCDSYDYDFSKTFGRSWSIEERLKVEKAEDLFGWLGGCLAEVVRARTCANLTADDVLAEIPLGITFSFPMIQSSLTKATLMPMGKGFELNSDHELAAMIYAGYARHTQSLVSENILTAYPIPNLKIYAISNDAVSTLISVKYSTRRTPNKKTVIGLILGTGCNAALLMKLSSLGQSKWPAQHDDHNQTEVVVNTEWTIRGAAGPLHELKLITRWDEALHKNTHSPGFQPFEYMTAGNYLGEVVRLVMVDWFINSLQIIEADLPPAVTMHNGIKTTFLAENVATAVDVEVLASRLNDSEELGANERWTWTAQLASIILQVERAVLQRSAALIAAGILGLLLSTGEVCARQQDKTKSRVVYPGAVSQPVQELVVAYCGGLICLYPGYKEQIQTFVDGLAEELVESPKRAKIVLREALEGGLVGAAVLAHCFRKTSSD